MLADCASVKLWLRPAAVSADGCALDRWAFRFPPLLEYLIPGGLPSFELSFLGGAVVLSGSAQAGWGSWTLQLANVLCMLCKPLLAGWAAALGGRLLLMTAIVRLPPPAFRLGSDDAISQGVSCSSDNMSAALDEDLCCWGLPAGCLAVQLCLPNHCLLVDSHLVALAIHLIALAIRLAALATIHSTASLAILDEQLPHPKERVPRRRKPLQLLQRGGTADGE